MMYFLLLSKTCACFKFEDVFKECFLYREQSPMIEPLVCLRDSAACTVGHNCMENLARRLHALFDEVVPNAELILLYFRKRNLPGLGAGVFWSDFREPRVITMNQGAWNRLKYRGDIYQFEPSPTFFLTGKSPEPNETPEHDESVLE